MNQNSKLQYEHLPLGSHEDLLAAQNSGFKKDFNGMPDDEDELLS